jgi:hypothetical protein
MPNEAKTILSIDDAAGLARIANFKKELGSISSPAASSRSAGDVSLRKAQADIAKYQRQRATDEEKLTRLLQNQSEQRSRNEIKAYEKALREIDRLRKEDARKQVALSSTSSRGFLTSSFNPISLAQGTAIGGAAYLGFNIAQTAIDKAIEQSRANRLIAASATEAGIAQDKLSEANQRFAKATGLSNVAAASTTASIQRLATFANRPGDVDKLLKAFADLGAARGISPNDLQNLVGTILSGQDEGLNRLGIADPGILQKAYAKSIGKTVEQLTQAEKVQSAVNAVLEKSAIFAGAAEARMNSLEGQVAKTSAQWENFTNVLSTSFATSGIVTDFLSALSNGVANLGDNVDNVKKRLREGATPEQIAKEIYPAPTIGDRTQVAAVGGYIPLLGFLERKGYLGSTLQQAADPELVAERHRRELIGRIGAQSQADRQQELAAYQERVANSIKTYTDKLNELREQDQKNTLAETKQGLTDNINVIQSNYKLQEAQLKTHLASQQATELQSFKKTTDLRNHSLREQIASYEKYYTKLISLETRPEERARLQVEYTKNVSDARNEIAVNNANYLTEQITKTRELKKELYDTFVALGSKDNPWVSLLSEQEMRMKRIREIAKDLGPILGGAAMKFLEMHNEADRFQLRISDQLAAFNLRDEAGKFRQAYYTGSTDSDAIQYAKRTLAIPNLRPDVRAYWEAELDRQQKREFQANIDQQLGIVDSLYQRSDRSDIDRHIRNQSIIELTPLSSVGQLSDAERLRAARAREEEAKYRAEREQKAELLTSLLIDAFTRKDGIQVDIGSAQDLVLIKNEAPDNARVDRGTPSSTNRRYSK